MEEGQTKFSYRVNFVVPDGDFYILLYTLTSTGDEHKQQAIFVVSHALLAEKCPALVTDTKDNFKASFIPVMAEEALRAVDLVLVKLHDLPDVSCSNSACVREMKCPGNACLTDMDTREMFWAARMTKNLGLTLPGFSPEDIEAWYLNLREKAGGNLQMIPDWYLLGSIARYMGLADLAGNIVRELQNNCVANPTKSPNEAGWTNENGASFGLEKDWPCPDPHLENILGPNQRRINQTKRSVLVDATMTTFFRLYRQDDPTRGWMSRKNGCADCPTLPSNDCFGGLKEAGINIGGTHTDPDGKLIWLPLEGLIKRLKGLRKVWAEDPGRRAAIDTAGDGCDAYKHQIELGEKLISMNAPTKDDVQALMSTWIVALEKGDASIWANESRSRAAQG